jgi:hypothetical protein
VYWTPPQKSENSCYNGQDRQYQSSRPLIKPGHDNLLSIRLNAEKKGDHLQPGLMTGHYLEQIGLPSAYLAPLFPSLSLLSAELSYAEAHFAPVSKRELLLLESLKPPLRGALYLSEAF